MTASISGVLFAICLGLIKPNPFGYVNSIHEYFSAFSVSIPLYLLYSFPAILVYGVFASIISDKIGGVIARKTNNDKVEMIISGIFHLLFGLILSFYSLIAAILFFIIDRLLQKNNKHYKWFHAVRSLTIPISVWLIFMGIVWVKDLI